MVSNNVLKDIQRLISITNTGLAFSKDPFDQERYRIFVKFYRIL